ncbi:hypothetical protein HC891_01105 [Candidatus Gracilibacteria bacterium]|nr:hypothetical protein [Candidatus Gracilibacteria bacterium]
MDEPRPGSRQRDRRSLGPLYWIWRPYMWAMPHRRFFSHSGSRRSCGSCISTWCSVVAGYCSHSCWVCLALSASAPH